MERHKCFEGINEMLEQGQSVWRKSQTARSIVPSFIECLGTDHVPGKVEGKELIRNTVASVSLHYRLSVYTGLFKHLAFYYVIFIF